MVRGCSNWWQHVDNFWKFLNRAPSPLERNQTTHAYRKVYTNQAITAFWIDAAPGTTTEKSANHSSPAIELQPLAELRRILELLLASWISCMHDVMTCQYLLTSVKFHLNQHSFNLQYAASCPSPRALILSPLSWNSGTIGRVAHKKRVIWSCRLLPLLRSCNIHLFCRAKMEHRASCPRRCCPAREFACLGSFSWLIMVYRSLKFPYVCIDCSFWFLYHGHLGPSWRFVIFMTVWTFLTNFLALDRVREPYNLSGTALR